MALAAENALLYPQRRRDRIRDRSNNRGVKCKAAELTGTSDSKPLQLHLHLYALCVVFNAQF